ncbi:MAG: right-handed parallel beta-helix repeat-containing protein, partial [Bacteroidales bacterium]|nr:right-handed parallel beta-helix repeat-containing protein [Bacteroidales bacterium]
MKRLLLTAILLVAAVIGCTAQKMKNVTVTNGNDFIKAIAPNTNITLKISGILSITDALNKMPEDRNIDNVKWDDRSKLAPGVYYVNEYDGRSIIIVKIDNLTITGGGSEMTHIQATPTYAEVLTFSHCNNVTIKNIMAGHVETGDCSGDVIFFQNCKKVVMEKCDLYGCGVNGLWMDGSSDVTVNNTEIHDCSDDYIVIRDCENILSITDALNKMPEDRNIDN